MMQKLKSIIVNLKQKTLRIPAESQVILFLSIVLSTYTFSRAALLSMTHDEVGTYLGYALHPVWDILTFKNLQLNNHLLNTLLIKLSITVFPDNEFTIRLPNLIGHILYLLFSWKILRQVSKDKYLIIAGFILLNVNPYLLDFFSCARGYGLEITMMMISIYFMIRFINEKKPVQTGLSMLFGSLGVLGNFTYLTAFLSTIVVINLIVVFNLWEYSAPWTRKVLRLLKANVPVILITVVLGVTIYGPINRLESLGEFSERANADSFWGNLVTSLFRHSLYQQYDSPDPEKVLTLFVQILLIISVITAGYGFLRRKTEIKRSPFLFLLIFVTVIGSGFYLQHVWLGSRYPQQRTALFLYPLIILLMAGLVDQLLSLRKIVIPCRVIILAIAMISVIHFVNASNIQYFLDWRYDSDTRQMLRENGDQFKAMALEQNRRIVIGTYWLYKPGIEFYERKDSLIKWIRQVTYRDNFLQEADFYYIPGEFKDSLNKFSPGILKEYPVSGAVLWQAPTGRD